MSRETDNILRKSMGLLDNSARSSKRDKGKRYEIEQLSKDINELFTTK